MGFLVGFNLQGTPSSFGTGTQQVLRLNFASTAYSNTAALNFCDTPVERGLASVGAVTLPLTTENGTVPMAGLSWPALDVSQTNHQVVLSWPVSASGFKLESAPALGTNWTAVAATPATNGASCVLVTTNADAQTFYRLRLQ